MKDKRVPILANYYLIIMNITVTVLLKLITLPFGIRGKGVFQGLYSK